MALSDMRPPSSPRGHPLMDVSEIEGFQRPQEGNYAVDSASVITTGGGAEQEKLIQAGTISSSSTASVMASSMPANGTAGTAGHGISSSGTASGAERPEFGTAGSGVINNAMSVDRGSKTTFEWCEDIEEVGGKLSGAKSRKAFQCRKEARRLIALATKETGRADGRARLGDAEKIRSDSHTMMVQAVIRKEQDLGSLGVKLDEMHTQANYFMLAAQKTVRSGGEARRLMTEAAEQEEKARLLMLSIVQARVEARNNWSKARTAILGGGKERMSLKAAIAKAKELDMGRALLGKGDQMIAWEMEQKFGPQVGVLVTKGLRKRQQSRHMSMHARNEARFIKIAEEILDIDTLRVEAQRHVLDAMSLTGADARMEMWASEEKHRRADAIFTHLEKRAKGSVLQLVSSSNHLDEEARMMFRDAQRRVEDTRSRALVNSVKKQASPDLARRVEALIQEQAKVVKLLDDHIEKVDKKTAKAQLREALELALMSMQMVMASLGAMGEDATAFLASAKGGREDVVALYDKAVKKAPKSTRETLQDAGRRMDAVMLDGISCAQDFSAVSLQGAGGAKSRHNSVPGASHNSVPGASNNSVTGASVPGTSIESLNTLRRDSGAGSSREGSETSFTGSQRSASSLNSPAAFAQLQGARLSEEVREELKRKTESAVDRRRNSELAMVREVEEKKRIAADVVLKGKPVEKQKKGWKNVRNVFKVASMGKSLARKLSSAGTPTLAMDDILGGTRTDSPLNPLWTPTDQKENNTQANMFVTPKFASPVAPPPPSGTQH